MKRYTPYIFPGIVLVIVLILVWRWYGLRAERAAQRLDFGEGVQIENLTDSEKDSLRSGVGDLQSIELAQPKKTTDSADDTSQEPSSPGASKTASGVFRYELKDDRVVFSVIATLPEPEAGEYQVWLKEVNGDSVRKAFVLTMGKGGYEGSAAVPADLLPFEVIVSLENDTDSTVGDVVLQGVVTKSDNADALE